MSAHHSPGFSRLDINESPLVSAQNNSFVPPDHVRRATTLSACDLGSFKQMRSTLQSHLERSAAKRLDDISVEQKIQKLKADFQRRFDNHCRKWRQANQLRLQKTTIQVLKAFAKMRKEEKIEERMAEFASEQLERLKTKRIFRQLKLFAQWQR